MLRFRELLILVIHKEFSAINATAFDFTTLAVGYGISVGMGVQVGCMIAVAKGAGVHVG